MRTFLLLLLFLSSPLLGQEPPKKAPPAVPKEATELVSQLASNSFAVREKARKQLLAMGDVALPAVLLGLESVDAEVVDRCKALLPELRKSAAVRSAKSVRDGKITEEIPLWQEYQKFSGNGPAARAVFADAFLSSSELFTDCAMMLRAGKPSETSEVYREAIRKIAEDFTNLTKTNSPNMLITDQGQLPADFPDRLTALLILGAIPGIQLEDAQWRTFPSNLLLSNIAFRARITANDERGTALKRVLEQLCRTAKTEAAILTAVRQCVLYEFRQTGRELALRGLLCNAPDTKLLAICLESLGRFGKVEEDLPKLLPLLKNNDDVLQGNPNLLGVEVADLALVALVRLTGQKTSDYKINESVIQFPYGIVFGPDSKVSQILRCSVPGFRNGLERDAAFKKWQEWAILNTKLTGVKPISTEFDPAQVVPEAIRNAENRVIDGRKFRNWVKQGGNVLTVEGKIEVGGKLKIELGGAQKNMRMGPGATGWNAGSSRFGTGVLKIIGAKGEMPLVLEAVDTVKKDQVSVTTIESKPESIGISQKIVTTEDTLTIQFIQTDKCTLTVKRQQNKDGKVLLEKSETATGLPDLRRKNPELFALGLKSILDKLDCKLPGD